MKRSICALVAAMAATFFPTGTASAAVSSCVNPGLSDHGDGSVVGTIEYCVNRGDVYLDPSLVYDVQTPINITRSYALLDTSGATDWSNGATVRAVGGPSYMVDISADNVDIFRVEFDGRGVAYRGIDVRNTSGVDLGNIAVVRTRNSGSSTGHLIDGSGSTNLDVTWSDLKYAGYYGTSTTTGAAAGVKLVSSSGGRVLHNYIFGTSSAGVDITGSTGTEVGNNKIHATGRATLYGGASADGITGYHNGDGKVLNWNIHDNDVADWANHGIHVSGRDIEIKYNTIRMPHSQAPGFPLSVKDEAHQPSPWDCTWEIWPQYNKIASHNSAYMVMNRDHKPESNGVPAGVYPTGNTDYSTGAALNNSTLLTVQHDSPHC